MRELWAIHDEQSGYLLTSPAGRRAVTDYVLGDTPPLMWVRPVVAASVLVEWLARQPAVIDIYNHSETVKKDELQIKVVQVKIHITSKVWIDPAKIRAARRELANGRASR